MRSRLLAVSEPLLRFPAHVARERQRLRATAATLDAVSPLCVREAGEQDELRGDTALVAAGDTHLEVVGPRRARSSDAPPIGGLRPRADVTLESAARVYGSRVLAAVLTGMGNDGEAGARAVRAAGGRTIVEDERSCVVYGMPQAVVRAGLADAVVTLDDMARAITESVASPAA